MNHALHQRRRSQRGFTLVELFIVISLMTIMAGLVIPSFMPDLTQRLESGADVVAADLAWSRSLAVTNNSSYRITFNTTASEYSLEHSGTNAALDILPRSSFGRYSDPSNKVTTRLSDLPVVGAAIRLYTVVKRTTAGNETSVATVEFGPLGETTRPESTIIWLTAGSGTTQRFIPLTVDPVTGLVTVGSMTNVAPGSLAGGSSTTPTSNG
jgi:prepilin-type N-terminal cleavage/methylation domain-containing protein